MLSIVAIPWKAKLYGTAASLLLNFAARRFVVFPEPASGEWKSQQLKKDFEKGN